MELSTGIRLINQGILKTRGPQRWADLGAGSGFFTRALASIVPKGSSVTAVDKDSTTLKSVSWDLKEVAILVHQDDFTALNWGENLDGILMGNALHYVRAQSDLLRKLKSKLSPIGRLLIVEYERSQANPWVPYPIAFGKLKKEAVIAGFSVVEKLDETPSTYDDVMIYSACLIP